MLSYPTNTETNNIFASTSKYGKYNFSNNKGNAAVTVYNFHLINTQNRIFIFVQNFSKIVSNQNFMKSTSMLFSITELFSAAN
jgi:hypothetical protein